MLVGMTLPLLSAMVPEPHWGGSGAATAAAAAAAAAQPAPLGALDALALACCAGGIALAAVC